MDVWRKNRQRKLPERRSVEEETNELMDCWMRKFMEKINRSTDETMDRGDIRIVENHSRVWFGKTEMSPNFCNSKLGTP